MYARVGERTIDLAVAARKRIDYYDQITNDNDDNDDDAFQKLGMVETM